jgi:hypothetical protein
MRDFILAHPYAAVYAAAALGASCAALLVGALFAAGLRDRVVTIRSSLN